MAIGFSNTVTKEQLEELGFKLEEDFDYSGLIIGLNDNGEPIKLHINIKSIFENGFAKSNTFTAASDSITFTEFIHHLAKDKIDAISQIVIPESRFQPARYLEYAIVQKIWALEDYLVCKCVAPSNLSHSNPEEISVKDFKNIFNGKNF